MKDLYISYGEEAETKSGMSQKKKKTSVPTATTCIPLRPVSLGACHKFCNVSALAR